LEQAGHVGYGECSLIDGLSPDNVDELTRTLDNLIRDPQQMLPHIRKMDHLPSFQFGFETAFFDSLQKNGGILFPSAFTSGEKGIQINGLIWMGTKEYMLEQIKEKLDLGFSCLKLKIGAINFEDELAVLSYIRTHFDANQLELRVDANGAFNPDDASEKLKRLSEHQLHSIEQPIKQGQWNEMAHLCQTTPISIALDEELIGITSIEQKTAMLETIKPQYIIIKPSLVGGLEKSDEWISLAEKLNIGWWATSALESNIGLNAIAQWTATKNLDLPQGLGTGQLFTNNIASPLYLKGEHLYYSPEANWIYQK
jgi:o-succinylbenzoate synthase